MPRARGVLSEVSMSSMAGWVLLDGKRIEHKSCIGESEISWLQHLPSLCKAIDTF